MHPSDAMQDQSQKMVCMHESASTRKFAAVARRARGVIFSSLLFI
jgi:hypothetical protein